MFNEANSRRTDMTTRTGHCEFLLSSLLEFHSLGKCDLFIWIHCTCNTLVLLVEVIPTTVLSRWLCNTNAVLPCISTVRVTTVREKSGKFQSFSKSGKSQGIFLQVREFCNLLPKSGKSQGILFVVPIDVYFLVIRNDISTRT